MEKISGIVRGSPRTASVDLKSSSAVRSGTPSFGRPIAESTPINAKVGTTASRAVALHNELNDSKKAISDDQIVKQMADQFFMGRIRRPQEEVEGESPAETLLAGPALEVPQQNRLEDESEADFSYKPRGSYVDVRV